MYKSYYGLTARPFPLGAVPKPFFLSRTHQRAVAYLEYGLRYRAEGLILITGQAGVGKTTLVAHLLSLLPEEKHASNLFLARMHGPSAEGPGGLWSAVSAAFSESSSVRIGHDFLSLSRHLKSLADANHRAILVVDEAQDFSDETFEQLRMLLDLPLGGQACLQCFLVGQLALRDRVLALEGISQRVVAAYNVHPLDEQETEAYVKHRLQQVGWVAHPTWGDCVFPEVFRCTEGVPRRIHLLMDHVLFMGAVQRKDRLTGQDIAAAATHSMHGDNATFSVPPDPSPTSISVEAADSSSSHTQTPQKPIGGASTGVSTKNPHGAAGASSTPSLPFLDSPENTPAVPVQRTLDNMQERLALLETTDSILLHLLKKISKLLQKIQTSATENTPEEVNPTTNEPNDTATEERMMVAKVN